MRRGAFEEALGVMQAGRSKGTLPKPHSLNGVTTRRHSPCNNFRDRYQGALELFTRSTLVPGPRARARLQVVAAHAALGASPFPQARRIERATLRARAGATPPARRRKSPPTTSIELQGQSNRIWSQPSCSPQVIAMATHPGFHHASPLTIADGLAQRHPTAVDDGRSSVGSTRGYTPSQGLRINNGTPTQASPNDRARGAASQPASRLNRACRNDNDGAGAAKRPNSRFRDESGVNKFWACGPECLERVGAVRPTFSNSFCLPADQGPTMPDPMPVPRWLGIGFMSPTSRHKSTNENKLSISCG